MCLLSHPGLSPCFRHCSLQCSGVSSVTRPSDRASLGSRPQAYHPDVVPLTFPSRCGAGLQPAAWRWCLVSCMFYSRQFLSIWLGKQPPLSVALFLCLGALLPVEQRPSHPSFPTSEPCAREQSKCSLSTVLSRELSLNKVIRPLLKLWAGGFVCKVLSQISRIFSHTCKSAKSWV